MATWLLPVNSHHPQPGSVGKKWNTKALKPWLPTGTTKKYHLNLQGEIHPVFTNWADADPDLLSELRQPLLLASRLVERAGLAWISDFLIDDIFDEQYPGRENRAIVRHHDAGWATGELKRSWIVEASEELKRGLPRSIEWRLDPDMFRSKGWVGYTCRHPRGDMPIGELDARDTIEEWDHRVRRSRRKQRRLSLLVMAEFPKRLKELARESEEYLLTAFMAAVTLIHELGHAIFWKDFRSLTREMTEPFYGGDLEMELGNSLIADIFGGWVPVPIKDPVKFREKPTLESGLAWRQHLDWKYHRMRPKYRAHYSIPVEYVARLFKERTWEDNSNNLRLKLQPQTLNKSRNELSLSHDVEKEGLHAAAALADFHIDGDGWRWNGRAGAPFRIPQYDGSLWPDLDMPVAIDGVIRETAALESISRLAREAKPSSSSSPAKKAPGWRHHSRIDSILSVSSADSSPSMSPVRGLPLSQQRLPASRLSQAHYAVHRPSSSISIIVSSSDSPLQQQGKSKEITVDELKKRLSRLIGVSMEEIDDFFTGS
ncbi:hypothetical protein LQW54_011141 [Pestalotiopsis sp. IQ-011]